MGKFRSLILLAVLITAHPANAADALVVNMDQTKILPILSKPSTVVVGNPVIADVSFANGQMFVQGKSFGVTNLILMDKTGRRIADYSITVVAPDTTDSVVMYKPNGRFSYVCAPDCQAAVNPSDEKTFFTDNFANSSTKNSLSMPSAAPTSTAAAPAPNSGG